MRCWVGQWMRWMDRAVVVPDEVIAMLHVYSQTVTVRLDALVACILQSET